MFLRGPWFSSEILGDFMDKEKATVVRSSGGVVVRKMRSSCEVLLIRKHNSSFWTLPKGHLEEGEREEEAAIREVCEETGYVPRLGPRLGEIAYTYERNNRLFEEHVTFYLMGVEREGTRTAKEEVAEVRWFSLHEAPSFLFYENERRILSLAQEHLEKEGINF